LNIHHRCGSYLLHIGKAGGFSSLLPSATEDREQNGCQNGDDSYDDEQFNQGKSSLLTPHKHFLNHLLLVYLPPLLVSSFLAREKPGAKLSLL
jgi:hypothetical protein